MKNLVKEIKIGDAVHRVAHPIAKSIDRVAGTKIQHCRQCQNRRDWLNELTK